MLQTNRHTNKQTDKQIDRHAYRQTDSKIDKVGMGNSLKIKSRLDFVVIWNHNICLCGINININIITFSIAMFYVTYLLVVHCIFPSVHGE